MKVASTVQSIGRIWLVVATASSINIIQKGKDKVKTSITRERIAASTRGQYMHQYQTYGEEEVARGSRYSLVVHVGRTFRRAMEALLARMRLKVQRRVLRIMEMVFVNV
jgi:hypothetical protein